MIAYVIRRLLLAAAIVLAVSFGAFCVFGLSLDPAYSLRLGPNHQLYAIVVAHYHLHAPIVQRYWFWLRDFAHHGFGRPVSLSVVNTIPPQVDPGPRIGPPLLHAVSISAQLVGFALVLVVGASVALGAACARRPGSILDLSLRLVAYATWSVPVFLVAFVFAKFFAGNGFSYGGTPSHRVFLTGPPTGGVVAWFRHMTLPAVALAIGLVGVYARYLRSALLVNLSMPYATVARAKGLSEGRVVRVHALRNSVAPFISALGLELGAIVGASLAADLMFGLGGLASFTIQAISRSDPFTLTAVVVTLSAFVMLFVTVTDLIVAWLDPRARIAAATA